MWRSPVAAHGLMPLRNFLVLVPSSVLTPCPGGFGPYYLLSVVLHLKHNDFAISSTAAPLYFLL